MAQAPARKIPKRYPAPEFPPRKPKLFARTPPAVFPVILGALGLGLALRQGAAVTGLPGGLVEALLGMVLGLWLIASLALAAKIIRRPAVVIEDLRVLPGRVGMAAASISVMAAAAVMLPYAPGLALALVVLGLVVHGVLAVVLILVLFRGPKEARGVNPGWHLSFAGFIVAALPLDHLGHLQLAAAIFWITLPVAAAIWGVSLAQLIGRIPPAPLRPLLAIHLAPAALFCAVAGLLDQPQLATSFALFGAVILLALVPAGRWITASGFSPLWGAFTFPLVAYSGALIGMGGVPGQVGLGLLVVAAVGVPVIGWQVLKLWPGGRLAARTNAAEA